tara:strand:+ start:110 stop:388 length:279 start_codon:yes stop_codon:yes gene_type:complete
MAFKMRNPFKQTSPVKQTYITDEMRAEKNAAELAFNKKMNQEGFSSDTNLEGASAELLALQERFRKSREGFIQKSKEEDDRSRAEKTGLYRE